MSVGNSVQRIVGGVDLGGTHAVCAVGRGPLDIIRQVRFSTRGPTETLSDIAGFFAAALSEGVPIAAIGISAFGPLDRAPASPDYGRVLATPKPGWAGMDILEPLRSLGLPLSIDTDVNGAALAEGRWGAARGLDNFAYVTVGTGIGVGVVAGGRLVNGIGHPELGHYTPPRHPEDVFPGCCPFHGDCLEGLASGRALAARIAPASPEALSDDHDAFGLLGHYLGHLCSVLAFAAAPRRIVFGGGVSERGALIERVRQSARHYLGGYLSQDAYTGDLCDVIVRSAWSASGPERLSAGVFGGFVLAESVSEPCPSNPAGIHAPSRHE